MKTSIVIVLLCFLLSELSLAHSGRTNSSGCHNNRKTGGYHCHSSGSTSSRSTSNKSYKNYSLPEKTNTVVKSPTLTTPNLVLQIQKHLNSLGFNAGPEDGVMGEKTREAIKLFQRRIYENVDGKASYALLERLEKALKK